MRFTKHTDDCITRNHSEILRYLLRKMKTYNRAPHQVTARKEFDAIYLAPAEQEKFRLLSNWIYKYLTKEDWACCLSSVRSQTRRTNKVRNFLLNYKGA